MLRQFFKLTFRNLWRQKSLSLLNIGGLAVGMTVALLIGLWIADEWSYDRFHENHDRLYQVMMSGQVNGQMATWNSVPLPLADELRESFPEVKRVAESDWGEEHGLQLGDKSLLRKGYFLHPDFLEMFSFPLLFGDPATVFDLPDAIVLTESAAKALFGHTYYKDLIGRSITIDNVLEVQITGILQDPPENSSLEFGFLMSFATWEAQVPWAKQNRSNWSNNSFQVFLELQEGADGEAFAAKVEKLIQEHLPESKSLVTLHALDNWRLYGEFENGKAAGGFIQYVRFFGIIAFIVLGLACINFMNLSTARSEKRSKEVGMRKLMGSPRRRLAGKFLGEAMVMAFLALVFALALTQMVLPAFNQLTEKSLAMPFDSPYFWSIALTFTLISGLLAGSYPAFLLSSFKPLSAMKGWAPGQGNLRGTLPRRALVVFQFTISTALIIVTLVVQQQIEHARNRPTGYDADRLVMVAMSEDLTRQFEPLKNELLRSGLVSGVTKASSPVTDVYANVNDIEWSGKEPTDDALFALVSTSEDYFKTLGIAIRQGRFFDNAIPSDKQAVIFNEAAIQRIGFDNPLEEQISWQGKDYRIVGVVPDVVMMNPYGTVAPAIYFYNPDWNGELMFRLSATKPTHEALAELEPIFKKYNPAYPFAYRFADSEYNKKFSAEKTIGKLSSLFAVLAIFISCLGILGLSAYLAERRTREIGIRKVLGASVVHLWALLSGVFVRLVLVSCLLAIPLATLFLNGWLEKYDYRISLGWQVFAAAGIATLLVTVSTVSFQGIRTALANPVESLRSE